MLKNILSRIAYSTNHINIQKPSAITFDLTDRCPLRCKTCGKWVSKGERQELDTQAWKTVISSLRNWLGNYRVCLSGGEPFIREDIFDIISFARKQGVYVTAVSSGYPIDEAMAKKIVDSGINGLSITLNGITPATHDFTRGVEGSHARALRAIELLNTSRKNMFVCVETVLMENNQREIPGLIEFTKEKKLNGISFQALYNKTSFLPYDYNHHFQEENAWHLKSPLWPKDYKMMHSTIDEIIGYKRKGYLIGNSVESLTWTKRYFQDPNELLAVKCMVGLNNFSIDPYGEVRLCFNMNPIGNVLQQTPKQIWHSKRAVLQRKAVKDCKNTCRILMCNSPL